MRRGKREEEKTTATELCRGFNQPNYSLITETRNLEQLTHTHKDTHPLSHMCNRSQLTSDNISQMRWKLQCQTDYFNSTKKQNLKAGLQQWQNKRMYVVSVIMEEEWISFPFSELWSDLSLESCEGRLILLRRSSKPCHYRGRRATTKV